VRNTANNTNEIYFRYGKRIFDALFALITIILLLPLFFIVSILVKFDSEGSIFFTQERVGKNKKVFRLYKFRTMSTHSTEDAPLVTSLNDMRITRLGHHLRRYKIDELPQLYNVLRGEMSIVGPRPEVQKYVSLFNDDYDTILQITPGLTDNAALKYRNEEDILSVYEDIEDAYIKIILPDKINLYKQYINDINFITDLRIIIKTIFGEMKN